jgi:hypothetical protein
LRLQGRSRGQVIILRIVGGTKIPLDGEVRVGVIIRFLQAFKEEGGGALEDLEKRVKSGYRWEPFQKAAL